MKRETRDRMRLLRRMLEESQERFYASRFQFAVLTQLAQGEHARFKQREAEIKADPANQTLKVGRRRPPVEHGRSHHGTDAGQGCSGNLRCREWMPEAR